MKSRVVYRNGWTLEIPKEDHAWMLLLEWVAQFRAVKIPLRSIGTDNASSIIVIRFHTSITKAGYQNCALYINQNS